MGRCAEMAMCSLIAIQVPVFSGWINQDDLRFKVRALLYKSSRGPALSTTRRSDNPALVVVRPEDKTNVPPPNTVDDLIDHPLYHTLGWLNRSWDLGQSVTPGANQYAGTVVNRINVGRNYSVRGMNWMTKFASLNANYVDCTRH